jgi:WD40 repeat protein
MDPGPSPAQALALSPGGVPGGQWVALAVGNEARLWSLLALAGAADPGAVAPALVLAQPAPVTALALSADGRRLAVANAGGAILMWDLAAPATPAATLARLAAPATDLAVAPGRQVLASAHGDNMVRLWALDGSRAAPVELAGHTDRISSLAFAPDGRTLASTGWEGLVRLWSLP